MGLGIQAGRCFSLIHDVLGNLFSLATVRVSGPHNSVVAVPNEFDGGLNLVTEMDSEANN